MEGKNKIKEWILIAFGVSFWAFIIWYLFKNANFSNPFDKADLYVIITTALLSSYVFIAIMEDNRINEGKLEEDRINIFPFLNISKIGFPFYAFLYLLPLIIPAIGFIVLTLFFIFNSWFYFLAVYLLMSLFVFLAKVKNNTLRIILILFITTSIYFGFKIRNIVKIKFNVEYKNEKIL